MDAPSVLLWESDGGNHGGGEGGGFATVYNLRIYVTSPHQFRRVTQKLTSPDENELSQIIFLLLFLS